MSNDFYNHNDGVPATLTRGASTTIRSEFDLVQAGFDKLPTVAQTFGGSANYVVAGGVADAWTASVAPTVLTSYADGLEVRVKFPAANTTATPTFNLNALGAQNIVSEYGAQLSAGDIAAGMEASLVYNSTFGAFQITLGNSVNSARASAAIATAQATIATTQAGIATTGAATATTGAATATDQATTAAAAALRAQQARDAANILGKIYQNTTDGIANTSGTGASNRYFSVPVSNSTTALTLYINNNGVAAVVTTYASQGIIVADASSLIGSETDALAIDANTETVAAAVVVRDTGTPANNYAGSLYGFLASTFYPVGSTRMIVDADGTLKWQSHQLGFSSEDPTTVNWARNTTTAVAQAAASDGKIPYLLTATSAASSIQQNPNAVVGQWYTAEAVLEKGTSSWAYIGVNTDGTNPKAWFNLNTVVTGTASAGLTSSISTLDKDGSALPANRVRCTVRFKANGTTMNGVVGQSDADNSTAVTSTRTFLFYRWHFHRGVKDIDYLKSTTAVLCGIPYDWSKGYRALLIEQMITNYRSLWCDDLTQAAWTPTTATPTLSTTGPHGEPCSTITATANNATVLQTTGTAATSHTETAWVRRRTGTGSVFLQINGTTKDITASISSAGYTRVKLTWTGASAVAVFGIKLGTSGDAVDVALLKCADQAFATSDMQTVGAALTQRVADAPVVPFTRFPSGASMTGYFDYVTADDMPAANSVFAGFIKTGVDLAYVINSGTFLQMVQSISSTVTAGALCDFVAGQRIEASLRLATNNHAASVNGFGASYDIRAGAPVLDSVAFGGAGGPIWLRKALIVKRALADDTLERWQYSGTGRDARYLDDVLIARYAETGTVRNQREPALSKFWDNADTASGFVTWMETNINVNPSLVELPARIRGRQWTVDKTTNRITLGAKVTLEQPTNWATGLGHMQSATIIKRTVGATNKGRVWLLWTQLDSANGQLAPTDWRRVYAAYSDDNLVTLSAPTVVYDRGSGHSVILSPSGNAVEMPADSAYPGRIIVPFYADANPNMGLLYLDPGGAWTLGATATIAGADEPTLALRPDGTLLMTIRTETPNQHYQVVISNGGTSFGAAALIGSGSYVDSSMSLSQMDPVGNQGAYGKMLLCGPRTSTPFVRDSLSVEQLVGQPVLPSGSPFLPIGATRFAGYTSSVALSNGLLLVAHEDSPDAQFNSRCSSRLMLLKP